MLNNRIIFFNELIDQYACRQAAAIFIYTRSSNISHEDSKVRDVFCAVPVSGTVYKITISTSLSH